MKRRMVSSTGYLPGGVVGLAKIESFHQVQEEVGRRDGKFVSTTYGAQIQFRGHRPELQRVDEGHTVDAIASSDQAHAQARPVTSCHNGLFPQVTIGICG